MAIPLHPNYASRGLLWALGPSQNIAAAKEVNEVQKIRNLFAEFPRREEGQTMAEYGVVLAVIALGVVVALGLLSGAISSAIDKVRGIL